MNMKDEEIEWKNVNWSEVADLLRELLNEVDIAEETIENE